LPFPFSFYIQFSQGIDLIHATTGMPYWATIVALTFTLRCALLPLAFGTMRNAGKRIDDFALGDFFYGHVLRWWCQS